MKIKEEINIKKEINEDLVKKIFGNTNNIIIFLRKKGFEVKKTFGTKVLREMVVKNWEYENDKNIIRKIFRESEKYQNGIFAESKLLNLIKRWYEKYNSDIKWPFVANNFDQFTAKINRLNEDEDLKDELISTATKQFRLIKEINTLRNDLIEKIIFDNSEKIMPTLVHNKSVDFFIDGIMFDQKVSKSLGNKLVEDLNVVSPKEYLKENPEILAKWMYENQDEERFDYDYRLYIAFAENDLDANLIKSIVKNTNFSNPIDIEFEYKHKSAGIIQYKTKCIVIIIG